MNIYAVAVIIGVLTLISVFAFIRMAIATRDAEESIKKSRELSYKYLETIEELRARIKEYEDKKAELEEGKGRRPFESPAVKSRLQSYVETKKELEKQMRKRRHNRGSNKHNPDMETH